MGNIQIGWGGGGREEERKKKVERKCTCKVIYLMESSHCLICPLPLWIMLYIAMSLSHKGN